jgi:outer membrane protein OmpA-like peptidoglycan-associated protein
MRPVLLITTFSLLLTSCQQFDESVQNNRNTYKGGGIGAILGGAIGSLTGDGSTERRQRAMVGAGMGALAGVAVGQYMDRQEDTLRHQLKGSGVAVQRQGNDILLNMPNNITFAFDSSNIQPQFYGTLANISATLNQYPETHIRIVGHTDSTGTPTYNQGLSERRAYAVSSFLSGQGVNSGRIMTQGMGESRPITSNQTQAGRAQNRRVEVRITPMRR